MLDKDEGHLLLRVPGTSSRFFSSVLGMMMNLNPALLRSEWNEDERMEFDQRRLKSSFIANQASGAFHSLWPTIVPTMLPSGLIRKTVGTIRIP